MKKNQRYTFRHPTTLPQNQLIITARKYFIEKYGPLRGRNIAYVYFCGLCEEMLKKERPFLRMSDIDEAAKNILLFGLPNGEILNEDIEDIHWMVYQSGLFEVNTVENTIVAKDIVFENSKIYSY